MIDHTGIGVADVARSAAFYDATSLGALGLRRVMQLPVETGADGVGYGVKQHTAFTAKNRAEVDAFHAAALKVGGTDNGRPGLRDISEGFPPSGYYAAFALDPDGNNMEAVCRER